MKKQNGVFTSIRINDQDFTNKIRQWSIQKDQNNDLCFSYRMKNGLKYKTPLSNCIITPTRIEEGNLELETLSKRTSTPIHRAVTYGEKYTVVQYSKNSSPYIMKTQNVKIHRNFSYEEDEIFNYFLKTLKSRIQLKREDERSVLQNVLNQLEKVNPSVEAALYAYCTKTTKTLSKPEEIIYPFGINESQIKAVESAFHSQVSIIEGPPGTGKTQTILNIIANILLQNKTVAILSNNNSAVENVYEKLENKDLDYLIAKLGSSGNREIFFENQKSIPTKQRYKYKKIKNLYRNVTAHLSSQNESARIQQEIRELETEVNYLHQWQAENLNAKTEPKKKIGLSNKTLTDFMVYLDYLQERRFSIKDRLRLLLKFRIIRTKNLDNLQKRTRLFYDLQTQYYDQKILQKRKTLRKHQSLLEKSNFKRNIQDLIESSMFRLKDHLSTKKYPNTEFNADNYQKLFDDFTVRYPIIGSSSHSIINSLAPNALLDYVIIDEASQQDIIPGILGLACAKNVVIVGDRKQLPHIPNPSTVPPPEQSYDCSRLSLLDSFFEIFASKVPTTLLREHYRCHPKIIQFCNQQFYNNELIPMTQDNGESALTLIITAKGNHTRRLSNLRELESLDALDWDPQNSRGFIAPFRNQANLASSHLDNSFVSSTIHKFQGRECEEIVFSTVLDHKIESQKKTPFVDNPHLVNVAVSRAQKRFILVTGDDIFDSNSHISALIRYMEYYANTDEIYKSPVVSAFDLLYEDYDESLRELNSSLRKNDSAFKSEQIVEHLLRGFFSENINCGLMFHRQVPLNQVVSTKNLDLSEREIEFLRNRASCDFVIYFKIGKTPVAVIEVDGDSHQATRQIERDEIKNSILNKANIPLLRLRTIESRVEERLEIFLKEIS